MAFDFPASPTDGQTFTPAGGPTYVFQSPVWKIVGAIGAPVSLSMVDAPPSSPSHGQMWWESDSGNLFGFYVDQSGPPGQWVQINVPALVPGVSNTFIRRQAITTSGAIVLHVDTRSFFVEVQGGGGGVANISAPGANAAAAGAGGGAGGYAAKWIIKPAGTYSPTCTIGAAGAIGGAGGSSVFTDGTNSLIADGGQAGFAVNSGQVGFGPGGLGGLASGGDLIVRGMQGGTATVSGNVYNTGLQLVGSGGAGGNCRFGTGGGAQAYNATGSVVPGLNPSGFGSGGSGGVSLSPAANPAGSVGATGLVVVTEFR